MQRAVTSWTLVLVTGERKAVGSSLVALLEDLPPGEKEETEGLSGRGLEMSRWSCGRAEPDSLACRVLEDEDADAPGEEAEEDAEPPLRVGTTAAWGVTMTEGDTPNPAPAPDPGVVALL